MLSRVALADLFTSPPGSHESRRAATGADESLSQAKYDLDDREPDETNRFVLRMIDYPWEKQPADMPEWQGAALIVGDNPAADALRARLTAAGVVVRDLPISDDLGATLAAFEQMWSEQPTPHLFIMTGRDRGARSPRMKWPGSTAGIAPPYCHISSVSGSCNWQLRPNCWTARP